MICVHITVGSAPCLWSAFGRLRTFVKASLGSETVAHEWLLLANSVEKVGHGFRS